MKKSFVISIGAAVLCCVASLVSTASASQVVTTPNGTWTAYPGQSTTYQAAVQQPINADGSSNFKANGRAVIPVKFALSQGTGPFVFQSIFSDNPGVTNNDYSFLEFDPNTPPTLAQLTHLIAVYAFTDGDCADGSLRWTVYLNDGGVTRNLDIHYQPGANGISGQFCQSGTSGTNRADMTSTDPYVVIQEFIYSGTPYSFTSAYNVTYAEAVSQLGNLQVLGMNLIVDSGWGHNADQVVLLTSATVATTAFTDTFTPQPASSPTPVCPAAQATIGVIKTGTSPSGIVNEPQTIQPQDDDGIFRIVDCKYMYNLATSSLMGAGTYNVYATIGSTTFPVATFDLK
jgi:hypothetical protein